MILPPSIYDAVLEAEKQSNSLCQKAWNFFDNDKRSDMTDTVKRFAARGWSTHRIYADLWPEMEKTPLKQLSPKGHFYLALAIEWAVRGANKIKS